MWAGGTPILRLNNEFGHSTLIHGRQQNIA